MTSLSLLPRDQEPRLVGATIPRAAQACTTCRKQKRKCDKVLPACSRCSSLQRACDYSEAAATDAAPAPSAEAFASLQMKLAEIEAKLDAAARAASLPPRAADDRPSRGSQGTPGSGTLVGRPEVSPGHASMGNGDLDGDLWMDSPPSQSFVWNKFPNALLLDSDVYKWSGMRIPKPSVDVPMAVLEILASTNVIEDAADTYFNTIHRWFPFISRKRMNLGISLHDGGPDLALLFLTMKLITTPPSPDMASAADSHLYTASKQFLALLESAGTASILYLQAMMLVALYEYGHSIYPAAWMTVGSCVRYASMLGLPSYQESRMALGLCTTWTESEERRRVWWATHILDRIVSLGSRRAFAGGPDPPADTTFLPVDDMAWDAGDMSRSLQRPVGAPLDAKGGLGPFARLAQASVLTSKAMAHCKRAATRYMVYQNGTTQGSRSRGSEDSERHEPPEDNNNNNNGRGGGVRDERKPFDIREVTEVLADIKTLCNAIDSDIAEAGGEGSDAYFAYAPSKCLLLSTSVLVLDFYCCPEHMRPGDTVIADESRTEGELAMQIEAVNGLTVASESVRLFAGQLLANIPPPSPPDGGASGLGGLAGAGADRVSPLCFDALYCALATFHWQWKESGQPGMKQGVDETKAALARVVPRWRLAAAYLEVGSHHDVTTMMGADVTGDSQQY